MNPPATPTRTSPRFQAPTGPNTQTEGAVDDGGWTTARSRGSSRRESSLAQAAAQAALAPTAFDPNSTANWPRGRGLVASTSSGIYRPPGAGGSGGNSRGTRSSNQTNNSSNNRSGNPGGSAGRNPRRGSGDTSGRQNQNASQRRDRSGNLIIGGGIPSLKSIYRRGTIITLPFHVPNTVTGSGPSDVGITATAHGLVYSTSRPAIVLWRFRENMICLPVYTFKGYGIVRIDEPRRREFFEVTNTGELADFTKIGPNPVLEADMNYPMEDLNCIHVSGAFHVSYREKIGIVGHMEPRSMGRIVALMNQLITESSTEDDAQG